MLALVDVLMPALNGDQLIELAHRQQEHEHGLRCIFILHSNLPEADLRELVAGTG